MSNPKSEQPMQLLDLAEVATILGTGERMARRLVAERQLPTVKVGRYVRVRRDDLTAYIERATRPAVER